MTEVASFTASSRYPLLDELARSPRPLLLRVWPDGAVAELASPIELRVGAGRLLSAVAVGVEGPDALLRVVLADTGRIEIFDDQPPPQPPEAYPLFEDAYGDAEVDAREFLAALWPMGGLGTVVVMDPSQLQLQQGRMPEAATHIAQLADGTRTIARIIAESPYEDDVTLAVLDRLQSTGVVITATRSASRIAPADYATAADRASWTGWDVPQPSDAAPTLQMQVGAPPFPPPQNRWTQEPSAIQRDTARTIAEPPQPPAPTAPASWPAFDAPPSWPPPARTSAPPPYDQTAAPAYVSPPEALPAQDTLPPRPHMTAAATPAPPTIVTHEDDDLFLRRQALGDQRRLIIALIFGAFVILLLIVLLNRSEQEVVRTPPPLPAPVVAVLPTRTPTVAVQPAPPPEPPPPVKEVRRRRPRYSLSNPPPVVGPDADARLRDAQDALREGRLDEAEALLAKLRRDLPRDAAVWVLSGMLEEERGRPDRAKKHAQKALRVNPRFYRAWILKGWLEQSSGDDAAAVDSYRQAVEIEPRHSMSREIRAVADGLQ